MNTLIIIITIIILNIVYGQRYIIDNDSDLPGYVAFPIDICFQNKFGLTTNYLKYICSDDGLIVTKTSYSDPLCTTQTAIDTFNNSIDSSPCGGDKFSCLGSKDTDAYVNTGLWVDLVDQLNCSTLLGTIPNVLGCYCDTDSSSYSVDCTDITTGTYITYSDSIMCNTSGISQDLSECYIASEGGPPATLQDPNVFAQINDCKLSTDTLEPSLAPIQSTTMTPTTSTTSTTSNRVYNSRYIIDNDWVLGIAYPFPFDVCLQTEPEVSLGAFEMTAAYIKYVCAQDGNSVTKYKWTIDQIATLSNGYDCNDTSSALIEVIENSETDSCKRNYFKCDGEDNYATATLKAGLEGSSNPDCDTQAFIDPLLQTSVATEVCFCGSDLSGKVTCDSNTARTFNYTGTDCINQAAEPSILGKAATCTYFISVDNPLRLNIFGVLDACIDNGADIYQTLDPTSEPSNSPTNDPTSLPTNIPTNNPTNLPTSITLSPTMDNSDNSFLYSFNSFNFSLLFTIFVYIYNCL